MYCRGPPRGCGGSARMQLSLQFEVGALSRDERIGQRCAVGLRRAIWTARWMNVLNRKVPGIEAVAPGRRTFEVPSEIRAPFLFEVLGAPAPEDGREKFGRAQGVVDPLGGDGIGESRLRRPAGPSCARRPAGRAAGAGSGRGFSRRRTCFSCPGPGIPGRDELQDAPAQFGRVGFGQPAQDARPRSGPAWERTKDTRRTRSPGNAPARRSGGTSPGR